MSNMFTGSVDDIEMRLAAAGTRLPKDPPTNQVALDKISKISAETHAPNLQPHTVETKQWLQDGTCRPYKYNTVDPINSELIKRLTSGNN